MTDMTPPPMKQWHVVVDSPELTGHCEFDVEARTEVEAEVKGAERALAAADASKLPGNLEERVVAVARNAKATER